MDSRFKELVRGLPPTPDLAALELRVQGRMNELEAKWSTMLERRDRDLADAQSKQLTAIEGDLGSRVAAVETRPVLSPADVSAHVEEGLRSSVTPQLQELANRVASIEARPVVAPEDVGAQLKEGIGASVGPQLTDLANRLAAVEARPTVTSTDVVAHVDQGLQSAVAPAIQDLSVRVGALEARPAVTSKDVGSEVDQRIQAVEPKLAALEQKVKDAVKASGEAWAERLRSELQAAVDDLSAKAAHAEEELRAAMIAQIELELRETQDQGTALREEIENRVRDLLKERLTEVDQKRAKDVRDLEQRLGLLVEGRSRDLESRLTAAIESARAKAVTVDDERVSQTERRLTLEQEARAAELAEAQTQTLAGFQVRMQSFFEQKLRENQEAEREKYVELLARFKGEVDQSLSRTIDSGRFDIAVQERIARALAGAREEEEKAIAAGVADAELRLKAAQEEGIARLEHVEGKLQLRETDLARVERTVRHDLEELDRRVQVLTDRMLPLVRRTWEKVGEIEKEGAAPVESDAVVKELRRELTRELRRVEGELLEQTSELRDKLESTLQSQGRIWLNFVRQLSAAGEELTPASNAPPARGVRRPLRAPVVAPEDDALLGDGLREPEEVDAFGPDPVNPLDPQADEPEPEVAPRETRARRRRS